MVVVRVGVRVGVRVRVRAAPDHSIYPPLQSITTTPPPSPGPPLHQHLTTIYNITHSPNHINHIDHHPTPHLVLSSASTCSPAARVYPIAAPTPTPCVWDLNVSVASLHGSNSAVVGSSRTTRGSGRDDNADCG